MKKINTNQMEEISWTSPKGKFQGFSKEPGRPHQLVNDGTEDLIVYVVADNPIGESNYYPDSGKWSVRSPERRVIRSEALSYFDGEE